MRNLESYKYEEGLFNNLYMSFKEFLKYEEKYGVDNEFVEEKLDELLYKKDYAEAIIRQPINVQLDGEITVGLDEEAVPFQEYLRNFKKICLFGERAMAFMLSNGETLAEFLDEHDERDYIKDGEVSEDAVNDLLSEKQIEPICFWMGNSGNFIIRHGNYRKEEEELKGTYEVEVVETLSRVVSVQATSLADAKEQVEQMYHECDIVLNSEDYAGVEYNILEIEPEEKIKTLGKDNKKKSKGEER